MVVIIVVRSGRHGLGLLARRWSFREYGEQAAGQKWEVWFSRGYARGRPCAVPIVRPAGPARTVSGSAGARHAFGASPEQIRLHLEAHDIEARPVWKPMHLQPVFAGCRVRGGAVAARLFEHGLCLPSGSSLTEQECQLVARLVRETPAWVREGARPSPG